MAKKYIKRKRTPGSNLLKPLVLLNEEINAEPQEIIDGIQQLSADELVQFRFSMKEVNKDGDL